LFASTIFCSSSISATICFCFSSGGKGISILKMWSLPIFKPLEGSDYGSHKIPDTEEIAPLLAHLYSAVKSNKINMNWSKHVSIFITPIEGRYFTNDQAKLEVTLYNLYKSKIGGMATREIAKLRRRLKVREVEDSFDSSEL